MLRALSLSASRLAVLKTKGWEAVAYHTKALQVEYQVHLQMQKLFKFVSWTPSGNYIYGFCLCGTRVYLGYMFRKKEQF